MRSLMRNKQHLSPQTACQWGEMAVDQASTGPRIAHGEESAQ